MKILIFLCLIGTSAFAQDGNRTSRDLPKSREQNDNSMWKVNQGEASATQGKGSVDLTAERKAEIEAYLKNESVKCSWETQKRWLTVTGCGPVNKVCIGVVGCEHPTLGGATFPSVYCTAPNCNDAKACIRDHKVDTISAGSTHPIYKNSGKEEAQGIQ